MNRNRSIIHRYTYIYIYLYIHKLPLLRDHVRLCFCLEEHLQRLRVARGGAEVDGAEAEGVRLVDVRALGDVAVDAAAVAVPGGEAQQAVGVA